MLWLMHPKRGLAMGTDGISLSKVQIAYQFADIFPKSTWTTWRSDNSATPARRGRTCRGAMGDNGCRVAIPGLSLASYRYCPHSIWTNRPLVQGDPSIIHSRRLEAVDVRQDNEGRREMPAGHIRKGVYRLSSRFTSKYRRNWRHCNGPGLVPLGSNWCDWAYTLPVLAGGVFWSWT